MNLLYPIREIWDHRDDSMWWRKRFARRVIGPVQKRLHDDDFGVMNEEWDVLIVLDGCREDLFREVVDVTQFDNYETKVSGGSGTAEWTKRNFSGHALSDVVYVTANPIVSQNVQTAFHEFIEVWRDDFDSDHGTILPESVTEAAVKAHSRNPDKRLIIHYMQPHYPFIGYPDLRYSTIGKPRGDQGEAQSGADDVWEALGLGLVDHETVWEAYADNLRRVMDSIDDLVEQIDGRKVITSDHGNLLGERVSPLRVKMYGHPLYIHHPALRNVPWAVIEGDSSSNREQVDAEVEEKLESLGYV